MSNASRERFQLKNQYFDYLKDTASKVDPYVRESISKIYSNSSLERILISRYRFGKSQLRPAQVRLAYELFGGKDWEKVIPACASVEAKDTGYYCLDDFLDKKKGKELVLLQGVFSSLAYTMISDLFQTFTPNQVKQVFDEITNLDSNNAKATVIDANLKQLGKNQYLAKIEGYNFWETPLRIGAILANVSPENINLIGEAGKYIGMGYIIANDTWDFGKELEDFRSGKYTLPITFLFENTENSSREKLTNLFGQWNLSEDDKDFIRLNAVGSGTINYGKQLAQSHCNKGIELLTSLEDKPERRLLEFATTMTQRNRFYDSLKRFE